MEKVILVSVRAKGFKGFKDEFSFSFEAEGKNQFIADNGQGKSSIGDAIAWSLIGKNAVGATRNINVKNQDSSLTEVETIFQDEKGIQHSVRRVLTKSTTLYFDGKEITQSELDNLIPHELFLMVFNPMFFLGLEANNQKKLITSVLPEIQIADVLAQMVEYEREFLEKETFQIESTATYIKNRQEEAANLKEELAELKGRLSVMEQPIVIPAAKAFDGKILEAKKADLEKLIIQAGQNTPAKNSETLEALEAQLMLLKKATFPNQSALDLVANNYRQIEKELNQLNAENFKAEPNQYVAEVKHLREMYASKHASYKLIEEKLIDAKKEVNTTCPTCAGTLPADKINALKLAQKENVEKLTKEIEKLGLEINELLEKGKASALHEKEFAANQLTAQQEFDAKKAEGLATFTKELEELKGKGEELKAAKQQFLAVRNEEIVTLTKKIEVERKAIAESKEVQNSVELENQIQQLRNELAALTAEQEKVMKHNVYVQTLEVQEVKRVEDIKLLAAHQKTLEERFAYTQTAIHTIKQFNTKRLEMMHQVLDAELTDVTIRLEKLVPSTGELKDCFDIMYKGKPLNICSTAEQIKVGLEISGMIAALKGIEYPVFVDNAESITSYNTSAKQIIEVRVEEGVNLTDAKRNRRVQRIIA